MKWLVVRMPDGSTWEIPLEVVAKDRGQHYGYGDIWDQAEDDLIDWSRNNMDWGQIAHAAIQASKPSPLDQGGYTEGWVNGKKWVISRPNDIGYPDGDDAMDPEIRAMRDRYPILKHFRFEHLPVHLQAVSRRFAELAMEMAKTPGNAETAAGLRKLMEAKDCAVRAAL